MKEKNNKELLPILLADLGNALSQKRGNRSLDNASGLAGIARNTASKIEHGDSVIPDNLFAYADALDFSILEYLANYIGQKDSSCELIRLLPLLASDEKSLLTSLAQKLVNK